MESLAVCDLELSLSALHFQSESQNMRIFLRISNVDPFVDRSKLRNRDSKRCGICLLILAMFVEPI